MELTREDPYIKALEERISDVEKFLHYQQVVHMPDELMTYASGLQMPPSQIEEMRGNLGVMMAIILSKWQKHHFSTVPVDPTKI